MNEYNSYPGSINGFFGSTPGVFQTPVGKKKNKPRVNFRTHLIGPWFIYKEFISYVN